jgi:hypothetical protein
MNKIRIPINLEARRKYFGVWHSKKNVAHGYKIFNRLMNTVDYVCTDRLFFENLNLKYCEMWLYDTGRLDIIIPLLDNKKITFNARVAHPFLKALSQLNWIHPYDSI